jgi:GH3 auxin-responsive promoter
MTIVPRFLVSFLAGLRTTRYAKQLAQTGNGQAAQIAIFKRLLAYLSCTELGRRQVLHPGLDYESFRISQPLVEHVHYQPFVDAMMEGETDVIWPGSCRFFVQTSGTTTGTPRRLPITNGMLANYQAGIAALGFFHALNAGHAGIFLGRHLHATACTKLQENKGSFTGNFDAITHLALSSWIEANLYAPSASLAQRPEGNERTLAIADHMLNQDVTAIAGKPAAVRVLADTIRERGTRGKARLTNLQALWPNLECYYHTGAPLGLLGQELQSILGPTVAFREVYAAAEGWFAVQDGKPADGMRLLTDAGIFFEFLPMSEYKDHLPPLLGRACVPLSQVKTGVDYALVITTPAGLCRYVVGDIVRFVSLGVPRIHFVGRTRMQLSSFEEQVSERELTECLLDVCSAHKWVPVNFHVAPETTMPGPNPQGRHEWWIELRSGTVKTPTGPLLAVALDHALSARNPNYQALRAAERIEPPMVRLVMPGVFEQWANKHRAESGGGLPCCRPDRLVADQLTDLTRFHAGAAIIG